MIALKNDYDVECLDIYTLIQGLSGRRLVSTILKLIVRAFYRHADNLMQSINDFLRSLFMWFINLEITQIGNVILMLVTLIGILTRYTRTVEHSQNN